MTCEERKDLVLLYATGALDGAERDELRAHIAGGCPTCAASLAEAHATLALLPLALPQVAPRPEVRDRLMQRVLSSTGTRDAVSTVDAQRLATSSRSGNRFAKFWSIVATAAAVAAIAVGLSFRTNARAQQAKLALAEQRLGALVEQSARSDAALADSQKQVQQLAAANDILNAEKLQMAALEGQTPQPQARGRVLWDHDHGMWHVSVFNLKPLPAGKEYELWFVPAGKNPVRAPTFVVDASGRASFTVRVPDNLGPLAATAITIEQAGGGDTPTMPLQLAGSVQ